MYRKVNLTKTTVILFLVTTLVKIFSLLREVLVASYIGMNYETDAFNIAIFATTILTGIAGIAISSALIPMMSSNENSDKDKESELFTELSVLIMIFFFMLTIILNLFDEHIFRMLAPGFNYKSLELTINLFHTASIKIILVIGVTFITQYLNKKHIFYSPIISSAIGSIFIVLYLIIMKDLSKIDDLMKVTVLSDLIQFVLLTIVLFKSGYRPKFSKNINSNNLTLFLALSIPAILSYSVQQIGLFIHKGLGSQLEFGSITALSYSFSIIMMINMTLSLSVTSVMYPKLSKHSSNGEFEDVKIFLQKGYKILGLFLIPATVGIMLLSSEICYIMFQRGAFTAENTKLTAMALNGFALSMFPYGVYEITIRFFYSIKETRVQLKSSILGVVFLIIASYLFINPLKIFGLSLAYSLMLVSMSIYTVYIVCHDYINFIDKYIVEYFIKIIGSTVIMGLVLLSLDNLFKSLTIWEEFLFKSFVAIIVYFLSLLFFNINKIKIIFKNRKD